MATPTAAPSQIVRFGIFELDMQAGELRRNGAKVRLEGQPLTILALLVQRPGQLVTREELQLKLWPDDTFVDFEHSINVAVKRLREALQDSATTPRYIETLPRRGYRFIYPVNGEAARLAPTARRSRAWLAAMLTGCLLLAALSIPGVRDRLLGWRVPGKIMRVAVLPLKNLSGDPKQDYFAAGMTEMVITELGRISALQVTSHQSVLGYTQSSKPLPQIASELNVDAVVEGTVQRTGERVRVTVNFVGAKPENHLLAESYDRDARDVLQVQHDVARALADAIRVKLPERAPPSSSARQFAPEAVDAYLRGTAEKDRDRARAYFDKAIEIDPAFARPYAALAIMYAPGGLFLAGGAKEGRKITRQWAEKALQLDPSLAEAHAALAWLWIGDWDFNRADEEFRRAIELNPSLALAHAWYARFLTIMGRYPEGIREAEIAMRLAPGEPDILTYAMLPYFAGGRMDEAIAHWRALAVMHRDYADVHSALAVAYMKKGLYREAVAEAEENIRLGQPDIQSLTTLACAYAKAGDRDKARKILRQLEKEIHEMGAGQEATLARVYAALGDNEGALALLEEAYRARRPGLPFISTLPQFDPLRSDPRFQDLLRRVGLPVAELK